MRVTVSNNIKQIKNRIVQDKAYYLLLLPALVYVIIFNYVPMYGLQISFKNYKPYIGITGSPWIGLKHFDNFFHSVYFWRLIRNTLLLSVYGLVAGFPLPIFIALLLNEIDEKWKKGFQTVLYAPHFISIVVLVGIINIMFSPSIGVVNTVIEALGGERHYFLADPKVFRHLYVWSGIWQGTGWGAIIYSAALAGINPELYEAATIDGATRFQKVLHISIPSILPTVIIMLILQVGKLVSVGYEKVYLLQNAMNQEVSEVISTYVYKHGVIQTNYSFSAAIGLFNNVVNVCLLLLANSISRKIGETSLF